MSLISGVHCTRIGPVRGRALVGGHFSPRSSADAKKVQIHESAQSGGGHWWEDTLARPAVLMPKKCKYTNRPGQGAGIGDRTL